VNLEPDQVRFRIVPAVFVRPALLLLLLSGAGCLIPEPASVERLAEFDAAGPVRPEVDVEQLVKAKRPAGDYRVVKGDILEFTMPAVLRAVTADVLRAVDPQLPWYREGLQPHLCRVSESGTITLPIVGEIPAEGKTLPEIESLAVKAYYPEFVVHPPAIVCRVAQYRLEYVSVVGGVENPGVYPLRSDEKSLVVALMKAGGISEEGAVLIRICHSGDTDSFEPLALPVKGLNIPFADVVLSEGDVVEVERLNEEVFSVIGLVENPGAFPYPPGVRYNVLQALAFAGGLNEIADPQYLRVYRQKADGEIVDATFKLNGAGISDASHVTIKPGDVVAVEQTVRTHSLLLLAEIFHISTGINADFRYSYNDARLYRHLEGKDLTLRD